MALLTLVGGCLALTVCGGEPDLPTAADLGVVEVDEALPVCTDAYPPAQVDTVASGLEVPWDVAFLPDGRALVTERAGRIRVVSADGVLLQEPWATLDVHASAESGLMGIDVHAPDDGPAAVFVAGTVQHFGSNAASRFLRGGTRRLLRALDPERGHSMTLTVHRIEVADGSAGASSVILAGVPSAPVHAGGAVRIGPDDMLYVTTGDGAAPWAARSPSSLRGKVLRLRPDGAVPEDNPDPGSPIYASGSRNSQGVDWDAEHEDLFMVEHGPTGRPAEDFRRDDDELNVVEAGDDLGWPIVTGPTEGESLRSPIASWTPAIAPGGLAAYSGDHVAWQGSAFVTGLAGNSLRRVRLEHGSADAAWHALCEEVLLDGTHGRLRLVRSAPDGSIWVGTSNRDQRGLPRPSDDLILRLRPSESAPN